MKTLFLLGILISSVSHAENCYNLRVASIKLKYTGIPMKAGNNQVYYSASGKFEDAIPVTSVVHAEHQEVLILPDNNKDDYWFSISSMSGGFFIVNQRKNKSEFLYYFPIKAPLDSRYTYSPMGENAHGVLIIDYAVNHDYWNHVKNWARLVLEVKQD